MMIRLLEQSATVPRNIAPISEKVQNLYKLKLNLQKILTE